MVLQLTTSALTLNGTILPAGTYTISGSSATLSGAGLSNSPDLAGGVSLQLTDGSLELGPGSGSLVLSGRPLDTSTGLSVGGFNGTVTVTAGAQTDTFQLNGTAAQVLRLSGSPGTISTDQNTTNPFSFGIDTTYADTYTIVAIAPAGWIIGTNAQGGLTITPAPGLQSGTFSIQLTAWPESRPDLVVQDQILVSVTAAQPGISLNVDADPLFTVPYHGAQLPTAFRDHPQRRPGRRNVQPYLLERPLRLHAPEQRNEPFHSGRAYGLRRPLPHAEPRPAASRSRHAALVYRHRDEYD